jgi:hypothetical protein
MWCNSPTVILQLAFIGGGFHLGIRTGEVADKYLRGYTQIAIPQRVTGLVCHGLSGTMGTKVGPYGPKTNSDGGLVYIGWTWEDFRPG